MDKTVTCTQCGEPVVWDDDIAAMRDGVCGDCLDPYDP